MLIKVIVLGVPLGFLIGIIVATFKNRVRSFSVGPEKAAQIAYDSPRAWNVWDD